MERDKMGFIFPHNLPNDPHTSFIDVAVLGSHGGSQHQIWRHQINFLDHPCNDKMNLDLKIMANFITHLNVKSAFIF